MSRWAHGASPANSLRNRPAVSAPPPPPELFFMSATSESIILRYFSGSGSGHTDSPARSAALRTCVIHDSSVPMSPATASPSATTHAPVSVEIDDGVGLVLGRE